jgi:hypothetical protein
VALNEAEKNHYVEGRTTAIPNQVKFGAKRSGQLRLPVLSKVGEQGDESLRDRIGIVGKWGIG